MSAFVSTPAGTPQPTPPAAVPDRVGNDGWYPAMSIAGTRDVLNVTTAITDPRMRDAIVGAMLAVNRQLRKWKTTQTATTLELVEQARINETGELVELYQRAVRAEAAALLSDFNDTLSATDGGRKREETEEAPADHHRRISTHCIRDIRNTGRTKVRLI